MRIGEQVSEKVTDSKRYGAVLIGALLGCVIFAAARQFGLTTHALVNIPTMAILAIAAIVDMQRKLIPDWLTLPGLAWALAARAFLGWPHLSDALLGVILCGGALLLFALISRGSIGGGDVKLMAMIGASLGWRWGFGVLVFAQLAAGALAICLLIARRKGWKDALPFGPFLAAFAVLAILGKPMQ